MKEKRGLSQHVYVHCDLCEFKISNFTSKKATVVYTNGPRFYEVNLCAALAFGELGKGHETMSNFCTVMNMLPPLSKASYANCTD